MTAQTCVTAHPAGQHDACVVREVGLRDGLQILSRVLPTEQKLQWVRAAHAAGLHEVEIGSFVPPKLMPQLADTAELVALANTLPGLIGSVLVPNLKGAERALAAGAKSLLLPLSASHAHSLANLKKTPDEALADLARIVDLRNATSPGTAIEVGLSTAFGCTIQGEVAADEVVRLVRAAAAIGVDGIGLADTVGYADPRQVKDLFERCADALGRSLDCGHFHDTRGLGLANVFACWQTGVRRFDACIGGLGGCPHAPGASGNVATEDVAYLLASMGVPTGLNFEALIQLRAQVGGWLAGVPLHGSIARAGLPKTMTRLAA